MKLIVRAKRVRKGDTFLVNKEKCFTVDTDRNAAGQAVIRFTSNPRENSHVNTLVIDPDFPMTLTDK